MLGRNPTSSVPKRVRATRVIVACAVLAATVLASGSASAADIPVPGGRCWADTGGVGCDNTQLGNRVVATCGTSVQCTFIVQTPVRTLTVRLQ